MVENITSQKDNFAQWYHDVVREAELAEPSEIRGCGIIRPYGLKIWELIKAELSKNIENTGVENVYFPIFVPLENIEAEKRHVEGFAPELAVVTHAGGEKLSKKLAIRPTSEAAMYKSYSKWIQSYKDLPLRLNQWNNAVRWEKRPRPFLRWSEFLWQEGHTVFATKEDAVAEMRQMLGVYKKLYEDYLAVPVYIGQKSELERFAGAVLTTTVEAMARDGKAIQGATSHYLGTNFAKVFNVKYTGEDGREHLCHQNSWGFSWRSIGVVAMVHGDNRGLRLPPNIAPIQAVIVPVTDDGNRTEVLNFANKIMNNLSKYRIKIDDRDGLTPGFKFNYWEVKGVPIRIEVGEKEIKSNSLTIFRRDTNTRENISINNLTQTISGILEDIHNNLYEQAQSFAKSHVHRIESLDDIKDQIGFFEASWSETVESEKLLKEKFSMVSRVLPREYETARPKNTKCFITGEEAKHDWYFAKSY